MKRIYIALCMIITICAVPCFSNAAEVANITTAEPITMFKVETAPVDFSYLQIREAKVDVGGPDVYDEHFEYISLPENTLFKIIPEKNCEVSVSLRAIEKSQNGEFCYPSYGYSDVLSVNGKFVYTYTAQEKPDTKFSGRFSFSLPLMTGGQLHKSYDDLIYILDISAENTAENTRESCRFYCKIDDKAPVAGNFTDVKKYHYYYEAVKWAVNNGMVSDQDTLFCGEKDALRSEVVTYIWKEAGSPEPGTYNPFTDISEEDEFYKAAVWAYEKGITTGTSDTEFSPEMTCTRAQVMTFIWRTKGEEKAADVQKFTDVDDSEYYADAVAWAVEKGITAGTSPDTFSPYQNCTRAHILTFLWRGLE
ncbi:MAG: S-layer homology domain-containing protein [Bacillota bacterium]|nr:S-layer homology domain-containing protein [Bacillota bacterium]